MIIDGCTNQMSLTPFWLCIASRDTNADASSSDNLIQAGLTHNKGIETWDSFCLDCASEWQTWLVAGTALLLKLTIILQITIPYGIVIYSIHNSVTIPYGIVIWRVLLSAYAPMMLRLCVKFQMKLGKTWNFLFYSIVHWKNFVFVSDLPFQGFLLKAVVSSFVQTVPNTSESKFFFAFHWFSIQLLKRSAYFPSFYFENSHFAVTREWLSTTHWYKCQMACFDHVLCSACHITEWQHGCMCNDCTALICVSTNRLGNSSSAQALSWCAKSLSIHVQIQSKMGLRYQKQKQKCLEGWFYFPSPHNHQ